MGIDGLGSWIRIGLSSGLGWVSELDQNWDNRLRLEDGNRWVRELDSGLG